MKHSHHFDAIVVGTGISGGWAAKELCEAGLRTLVLERGRDVRHALDYLTMGWRPWDVPYDGELTRQDRERQPVQSRNWAVDQTSKHFFADDAAIPYVEERPFSWIRGNQVGGRSLTWSRQCYRLSDLDFEANAREGIAVDWPIRYADLAPFYDHVERFAGVSGQAEGLAHWPDGQFLPPMPLNCVELSVKQRLAERYPERVLTIGRCANLTRAQHGRASCQSRDLCVRGCPFGAYFSSNSATLPRAARTGKLTLRPHSVVSEVIYDEAMGRARGVVVIDAETRHTTEYFARIIFLNASTLGTTAILLGSRSARFPNGLGNDSGELGHNLMDHFFAGGAWGRAPGFESRKDRGRRPNGICIPRFVNVGARREAFARGYYFAGGARRGNWSRTIGELGLVGEALERELSQSGRWSMGLSAAAECLPYHDNRVSLSPDRTDAFGLPQLSIDCTFRDNEAKIAEHAKAQAGEMLEAAGIRDVVTFGDELPTPGGYIHEMGTARMGRDPKTSVLGAHNQIHAVPNVFVTDGSCMTSSACQNPSLTYMALTARAAAFAVGELRRGQL